MLSIFPCRDHNRHHWSGWFPSRVTVWRSASGGRGSATSHFMVQRRVSFTNLYVSKKSKFVSKLLPKANVLHKCSIMRETWYFEDKKSFCPKPDFCGTDYRKTSKFLNFRSIFGVLSVPWDFAQAKFYCNFNHIYHISNLKFYLKFPNTDGRF